MDYQVLFNVAVGAVGLLIGVVMKTTWDSIRDIQQSHKELVEADAHLTEKVGRIEVLVAGQYLKRDLKCLS